jgi:4-hydroxy-2-oxoheptanedioate aldolase
MLEVLAVGVIENIEAVETVAEVVSTPGIDMVVIGPGDLATSMGLRGRSEHPDVQAAISKNREGRPRKHGGSWRRRNECRAGELHDQRGYRALMVGFD